MTQNKQYSTYAQQYVIALRNYIDSNPIGHKNLKDLWSVRPGESRSSTEKAFKHLTGYRIKEYLVKVRLEHTKQFLRRGMSIKNVSTKCFYKSQSAYCTAFKRFFKQSPTDWLKEERP